MRTSRRARRSARSWDARPSTSWRSRCVYSVDLGGGRVLWLFGDTFVATSDANVRAQSKMPRNTLAIRHGYDFYWATTDGAPDSFFASDGAGAWFWPAFGSPSAAPRAGDLSHPEWHTRDGWVAQA